MIENVMNSHSNNNIFCKAGWFLLIIFEIVYSILPRDDVSRSNTIFVRFCWCSCFVLDSQGFGGGGISAASFSGKYPMPLLYWEPSLVSVCFVFESLCEFIVCYNCCMCMKIIPVLLARLIHLQNIGKIVG